MRILLFSFLNQGPFLLFLPPVVAFDSRKIIPIRRTGISKQKKRENEMSPGLLERCRKRKRKAFCVIFHFPKTKKKGCGLIGE